MGTETSGQVKFPLSKESAEVIAKILASSTTRRIIRLLYDEALKGEEEGKLKGLAFNEICRNVSASRTTIHRALAELTVRDKLTTNDIEYTETPSGRRVATIYRLNPEIMAIVEFLYPSLPSE